MRKTKKVTVERLLILGEWHDLSFVIPVDLFYRYSIFIRLIEEGTVPDLYEKFAMYVHDHLQV
jgi:hypothetical protein